MTRALALGDRALWELPAGLTLPPRGFAGRELLARRAARSRSSSTSSWPGAGGTEGAVPADPNRREMTCAEVIARLQRGAGVQTGPDALDYYVDVGERLRVIVLDLVRRAGGSGGLVRPGQRAWLALELAGAGERWVIVVSHQPLASSDGGDSCSRCSTRTRA